MGGGPECTKQDIFEGHVSECCIKESKDKKVTG